MLLVTNAIQYYYLERLAQKLYACHH